MTKLLSLRKLLPIALIGIGVGALLFFKANRPQTPTPKAIEKSWVVNVIPAIPQSLSPTLTLYGRIESPHESSLTGTVDADVTQVNTLEGETVIAGQTLIILDDRDARLLLAQRSAELAEIDALISSEKQKNKYDLEALAHEKELVRYAERQVNRRKRLSDSKIGTELGLDEAKQALERQALVVRSRNFSIRDHDSRLKQLTARRNRAAAQRDQVNLDLERTRVRAPFPGRVTAVHVAPGDHVRKGNAVIDLYDLHRVEVRAQVPSRYLSPLRNAVTRQKTISAQFELGEERYDLHLDRLGGRVQKGQGGVDALFIVETENAVLEMGTTVTLKVNLPTQSGVIALPYSAVYDNDRVYKLVEGRMRRVLIGRVGEWTDSNGQVHILVHGKAFEKNDKIIVSQIPNAVEGLRVRLESFKNNKITSSVNTGGDPAQN